jgi:hypothetical protein
VRTMTGAIRTPAARVAAVTVILSGVSIGGTLGSWDDATPWK